MIFESLKNADGIASINDRFAKGIAFLRQPDLAFLSDGKYPIDGSTVFASIQSYTTKPSEQCVWESHIKYADIQYIITGQEAFGYAPLETMHIAQEYNADKDIQFLEGTGIVIPVLAGNLLVFAPHDAHKPGIAVHQPEPVRKVVVKVAVL